VAAGFVAFVAFVAFAGFAAFAAFVAFVGFAELRLRRTTGTGSTTRDMPLHIAPSTRRSEPDTTWRGA